MTKRMVAVLVAVTVVVLFALEVPLAVSFERQRNTEAATALERDALAIGDLIEDHLEKSQRQEVARVAESYADQRDGRIVIVDPEGVALADSSPSPGLGETVGRSFKDRPEIVSALAGRTTTLTRHSNTLGESLLVVAAPIRSGGRVLGAVRVSRSRSDIDAEVHRYQLALVAIALLTLAVASGLGYGVGRWASRPLADLRLAAVQIERGDLKARAPTGAGPPEVRDLSVRFNAMAERLSVLVKSSQEFAADASHQLRTPLTALRLRLDNLAAAGADGDAVEGALQDVGRLNRTIDALLAFTRIEQEPSQARTVDVGEAVESRASFWQEAAADKGVSLDLDTMAIAAGHSSVVFDPNHLEQVLDNLIANAIEAAPPGSTIEMSVREVGEAVEVHVTDHGAGLSAADRVRAFDRHWGLRPDGTGLGLSIVTRLCAHNRASARLDETVGGGLDAVIVASRDGGDMNGSAPP